MRATHFELGTHPFVGASTTHTAHNQKKSDVSIQSRDFQKSNFALGDGPKVFATTYNASTAGVAAGGGEATKPKENKSFKSSLDLCTGPGFHG